MTVLIPVVQERLSQESQERTQTSQINMQNAFSDYDKGVLIFKGSGAWSKLHLFSDAAELDLGVLTTSTWGLKNQRAHVVFSRASHIIKSLDHKSHKNPILLPWAK